MIIKVKRTEGVVLPKKAHEGDAGFDVFVVNEPKIVGVEWSGFPGVYQSIDYIEYDTKLSIEPPILADGRPMHVDARPRSSNSGKNLILCNSIGLIDNIYRGTIRFRFKYFFQASDIVQAKEDGRILGFTVDKTKIYKIGDACGQLVPLTPERCSFMWADEVSETQRGEDGFGSTDKKV